MDRLEEYLSSIGRTGSVIPGSPRNPSVMQSVISVSDPGEKAAKMLKFMKLVLKKNEVINLTTITERDEFIDKHLIDSVACYGWPEIGSAEEIVDVGTGAGFPGVPLAILYPEKHFVLVDSLAKRIDFLREALTELKIENIDPVHSRAEDMGRDKGYRESFDLCLGRAVGKLSVLLEYCLPLVKTGGEFYAYKTEGASTEIEESKSARFLLGGSKEVEVRPTGKSVPLSSFGHNIMVIKKERPTPKTYPRKAGTPAKVPL
jgi:16S rRNA (guanine527-N7)-methyltransferase